MMMLIQLLILLFWSLDSSAFVNGARVSRFDKILQQKPLSHEIQPINIQQSLNVAITASDKPSRINESSPFSSGSNIVLKTLLVFCLVLQNSGLSITMRMSHSKNLGYIASTAVVCSEVTKLFISSLLYLFSKPKNAEPTAETLTAQLTNVHSFIEIGIPSILYVLQNNLQYLATSTLPAAVYQVLVQLKLITTATFATYMLRKPLSLQKWLSIIMLTFGVVLVQLSVSCSKAVGHVNLPVGLLAVGLTCITSAIAGVQTEKIMKRSAGNIWVKNMQMTIMSMLLALAVAMKDLPAITSNGFFTGYNPLLLAVIALHAVGGIMVSLVVTHTSSIVKGFATSGSIILTSMVSAFVLGDIKLNFKFVVGALTVCLATFLYSLPTLSLTKSSNAILAAVMQGRQQQPLIIAKQVEAEAGAKQVIQEILTNVTDMQVSEEELAMINTWK